MDTQPQMIEKEEQPKPKTLADIAAALRGIGASGPDCVWCNAPTRKTGACWTCIACGSTSAC